MSRSVLTEALLVVVFLLMLGAAYQFGRLQAASECTSTLSAVMETIGAASGK